MLVDGHFAFRDGQPTGVATGSVVRGRVIACAPRFAPVLTLCAMSACGGDGGFVTPAPAANQPPVFSSATAATVVESSTAAVYQAVATDPNGDAVTYSTVGGADAARFTMSATGQLSLFVVDADGDVFRIDAG